MKTIEDYKRFVDESCDTLHRIEDTAKKAVTEIVKANGSIVFDYMNGNAPCTMSTAFGADTADCYITYMYYAGESVFADLYAYYLCEDCSGRNLGFDEPHTDWLCILEFLINQYNGELTLPES